MQEVLVNRLGGLSLPRKSVVSLTDRPDMPLDVYRGRKTTIQPTNTQLNRGSDKRRTWCVVYKTTLLHPIRIEAFLIDAKNIYLNRNVRKMLHIYIRISLPI